ncbi:MAG TPA: beta-ketoacyl synthase N-terminal-like domain-containing protein [Cellvibrio sp.]|nr:beta-ketoacyl synthase N-terminal-like domain-containing protein [Cellvibrio sp.]
MSQVYIAGFGLASTLASDLAATLQQPLKPQQPAMRQLEGYADPVPYFAIAQASSEPLPPSWYARCRMLVRSVIAESGCSSRTGALYLASASINLGAIEAGEDYAVNLPGFLDELAAMLEWQGPVFWINTACTSGLNALMAARDGINAGLFDEAIVLGVELENRLTLAGFAGMQLLSSDRSRPFATDRNGLVLGEAVAALRLSRAPSRWRIAGGAQVIDSSQASGASVAAYLTMLEQTLARAQLTPEEIQLVKVQAAGSPANDAIEAQALNQFFAPVPALISLKPLLGHTLGASGAAELALLLSLIERDQWPTPDTAALDPQLNIALADKRPSARYILACNLGFGGSHSALAIEDRGR